MKTRNVMLTCVLAIATPALSQSPASFPYVGELTGVRVHVRTGPSTSAYACTMLNAPARVTVVAERDGWLKIVPPANCFSVVAQKYLTLAADGKTATVAGDNVYVRAGGNLFKRDKLDDYQHIQKQLNRGDCVEVLFAGGDYYAIVSPPGAFVWISAEYVKPVAGAAAATVDRPASAGAIASAPASDEPTSQPAVRNTATQPAAEGPVSSRAQAALDEAEKELAAEFEKPVEQRDLQGMLAKYKAIDPENDEYVKACADLRLEFLQDQIDRSIRRRQAHEMFSEIDQELARRAKALAEIEIAQGVTANVPQFAAKGILAESALFPGTAGTPKRFIIHNPQTREIAGYAQSANPALDLREYVGKCVGLIGSSRFDREGLRAMIIEVQSVVLLDDSGEIPSPPKPVIKPLPPRKPRTQPADTVTSQPAPAAAQPAADDRMVISTPIPPTGLPMAAPATAPAATQPSEFE